jgi:hypothetical protein
VRDASGSLIPGAQTDGSNTMGGQEDALLKISIDNALQAAATMPYPEFVAMA